MKTLLRSRLALVLALVLTLLGGAYLSAQQFTPPSSNPPFPISVPSSTLLATATAAANSAATATLTPGAGQYAYVTAFEITVCGNATGDAAAATPSTFTWAGMTTNGVHKIDSTHTAGVCYSRFYNLTYPMKSATTGSGVAITLISSNITNMIPNINIWGYYGN